jgi:amino-acid N-acetyltransferase
MHRMINEHADGGKMLGRPLSELYENLRDFSVVDRDGTVAGCCALHINWDDLAEVRSLAVDSRYQGVGVGKALVLACLAEARNLGLSRVFALTREAEFFVHLGFKVITVAELPRKVWGECYRCPKFPECDEVAVVVEL